MRSIFDNYEYSAIGGVSTPTIPTCSDGSLPTPVVGPSGVTFQCANGGQPTGVPTAPIPTSIPTCPSGQIAVPVPDGSGNVNWQCISPGLPNQSVPGMNTTPNPTPPVLVPTGPAAPQPQSSLPPWVLPLAIGGGAAILLLLLMKTKKRSYVANRRRHRRSRKTHYRRAA